MKYREKWKNVMPVTTIVLWTITVVLFYYNLRGLETTYRWFPACFVGAVISTAVTYALEKIYENIRVLNFYTEKHNDKIK